MLALIFDGVLHVPLTNLQFPKIDTKAGHFKMKSLISGFYFYFFYILDQICLRQLDPLKKKTNKNNPPQKKTTTTKNKQTTTTKNKTKQNKKNVFLQSLFFILSTLFPHETLTGLLQRQLSVAFWLRWYSHCHCCGWPEFWEFHNYFSLSRNFAPGELGGGCSGGRSGVKDIRTNTQNNLYNQ